MPSPTPILKTPEEAGRWRAGRPPPVVVAGSFDLIQPGNLRLLELARALGGPVLAVPEPDGWNPGQPCRHPQPVRARNVSCLKTVSAAAAEAEPTEIFFRRLQPYAVLECPEQPEVDLGPAARLARRLAADRRPAPALAGCFTRDIRRAIADNRTPLVLPADAPWREPDPARLREFLERRRREGRRLATMNGCFDLLHAGHLETLRQAAAFADDLAVLVNDDASVRAYKGPTRPVFPLAFRLAALTSLAPVSLAWPFSGDNPLALLRELKPDIHLKGGSFEEARVREERGLLESWGGRLAQLPLVEGHSTTDLVRHFGAAEGRKNAT